MAQTKIKAGLFEGIIGNGTDGYYLMSNGDGTMTWSSIIVNPNITNVAYPGSVTAANPAGGETITLTGTGFKSGATVTVGGTTATTVSYISGTQITFTTPPKTAGDYDVVVTNTDTGSTTYINGISYNGIPSWTTATGSLGTFASDETISTITLQATEPDAGTITFNITSGALPTGLSLTGADIDGTTSIESADTTYNFTVTATDDESQSTGRAFSITVEKYVVQPLEHFTINTYEGNGSTQSIEGKIGTAASFNGNSSEIDIPHNTAFDATGGLSVSLWINKAVLDSSSDRVMDKANGGSGSYGWEMMYRNDTGYRFDVYDTSNNVSSARSGSSAISAVGVWDHVVATVSSTGVAKIYVNGVLKNTTSALSNPISSNTGSVTIGRYFQNNNGCNATFDQIRFFNTDIDQTAVTTLYNESNTSTTKSTTDIFDDGSGVALYEFEGNANDTGAGQDFTGQSADFNGNSQINISSNSVFDTTSNFSVSLWVNRDSTSEKCLINKLGSTAAGWFFTWNPSYGYWFVNYNGSGNASTRQNGPSDSVGEWTHLVLTWNASTYTPKLYINGVSPSSNITSSGGGGSTNSNNFEIGGSTSYSGMAHFDGQMDDVKWFSSVISDSDIEKLSLNLDTTATPAGHWKLDGNANDSVGSYNGTWTGTAAYSDPAETPKYNGTPTDVSFVGTLFEPDLVWVKARTGSYWHRIQDSVRGAGNGKSLSSNGTISEGTYDGDGYIDSLDTNGFTVAGGSSTALQTNGNGGDYVAWCWKAGGAAVSGSGTGGIANVSISANTNAGFSIVKYDGAGANATVEHGLNSAPQLIFVKRTDASGNWITYAEPLGVDKYLYLNDNASEYSSTGTWGTAVDSTSFGLTGTFSDHNNSSGTYIAYCFHSVDGYQKIGSYTGNSSTTGPLIDVGFRPRFILVKGVTSGYSSHWLMMDSVRDTKTEKNLRLLSNSTANEETDNNWKVEFNDNGFQPKSTFSGFNDSNGTYIYLAIA